MANITEQIKPNKPIVESDKERVLRMIDGLNPPYINNDYEMGYNWAVNNIKKIVKDNTK